MELFRNFKLNHLLWIVVTFENAFKKDFSVDLIRRKQKETNCYVEMLTEVLDPSSVQKHFSILILIQQIL